MKQSKGKKESWKELPCGDILEAGTSLKFQTGDWRNRKPVHDRKKCTDCLLCWLHCPDGAVKIKDGKFIKIDLRYCKGCGICSRVCPVKAISMKNEKK